MDNVRLFIAFEVPEKIRNALARDFLRLSLPHHEYKLIPNENYHIALKFLRQRTIEEIPQIIQALDIVCSELQAPELTISGGAGIPAHKPKALGLAVEETEDIKTIFTEVEESLAEKGLSQRETRIYHPHITTARIKKSHKLTDDEVTTTQKWTPKISYTANTIALIEMKLFALGPAYTIIQRFPLLDE